MSIFRFDEFVLDVPNRRLSRGGEAVELSSRYFDALALLVAAKGGLVAKQRFFEVAWAGMVVTDAALTQGIKDIRRALGDDASHPRFVRTVPGHGYRFIPAVIEADADTASAAGAPPAERLPASPRLRRFLVDGIAGTLGGGAAGILMGLVYGSALASAPQAAQGLGASAVLVVLLALTVVAGLAGGFGVSFGMAAGRFEGSQPGWTIAGAAFTGFVVGGLLKLVGSDALRLLFGTAPPDMTGAVEGAVMGLAVAGGTVLAGTLDAPVRWRPVMGAALCAGLAGAVLAGWGGSLMGGSLELVSRAYADSRLDVGPLGRFFGEPGFGTGTRVASGGIEGLVFGACVSAAMVLARRLPAGGRAPGA